jgi:hypothetical protein
LPAGVRLRRSHQHRAGQNQNRAEATGAPCRETVPSPGATPGR